MRASSYSSFCDRIPILPPAELRLNHARFPTRWPSKSYSNIFRMVRGRTTGRGGRRGAAAAGSRPQPESTDATADANQASTQPDASAGPAPASSSAAGASTQSPAMAPARRGATAQASRGASIGRFRPKNVRRDEAERDSLARQEEQKANERVAAERRARGRSRFRSKRSRGDTMGSRGGGFGRTVTGASGPFSSGMGQSGMHIIALSPY